MAGIRSAFPRQRAAAGGIVGGDRCHYAHEAIGEAGGAESVHRCDIGRSLGIGRWRKERWAGGWWIEVRRRKGERAQGWWC